MAKVLFGSRGARKKKRVPPNKISVAVTAANLIVLALVVLASVPLTVPRAFGYQPYTVVSGSMEPAIPVGSLVYVKNRDPAGVAVDEVAAFYKNGDPGTIIVHRVLENDRTSGQLTTKGDANAEPDFEPVAYSACIGTVEKTFAGLGGFADAITSTAGRAAVFCLVGLGAALQIFANVLDKHTRKKARQKEEQA